MPARKLPPLTLAETRVLGVLVEKERTVPDTYPLSLNALVTGCNQKNNRDPIVELADAEVQAALDELKRHTLVIESSGARVVRHSHNLGRVLKVPTQAEAILAVLFLRGPQTAGELRIGSERLHKFADISSVEGFLEEMATRPEEQGGALVLKLERVPGEREQRWAHLLSGPVKQAPSRSSGAANVSAAAPGGDAMTPVALSLAEAEVMRSQLVQLAAEVADLRAELRAIVATLQENR